jgi:carbon storage regulator
VEQEYAMMLLCTRKAGEQIVIGDQVCLTVLAVRGNRVQLGVSAPEEISIYRNELLSTDPRMPEPQPKDGGKPHEMPCV